MYDFNSLLVNGGPLSEIMVFGKPCLANVFSDEHIVEVADVFRENCLEKILRSQHIQCLRDALEFRQCITVQGYLGCQHFDIEDSALPRSLLDCLFLETTLSLLTVVWFSSDLNAHDEQAGLPFDVALLE